MLRILKTFKNAPPDTDNLANVAHNPVTKVDDLPAGSMKNLPGWQSMSSRLMQKLTSADEAVPELQMPVTTTTHKPQKKN